MLSFTRPSFPTLVERGQLPDIIRAEGRHDPLPDKAPTLRACLTCQDALVTFVAEHLHGRNNNNQVEHISWNRDANKASADTWHKFSKMKQVPHEQKPHRVKLSISEGLLVKVF